MLAFLIYFPKLYFIPQYSFILAIIYVLIFRRKVLIKKLTQKHYKYAFLLILIISFLSTLNYLFGLNRVHQVKNIIPPIMYIFTFLIAISLNKKDLKILFWLLFVEVIFIYIEFFLKINTIYFWQKDFKHFDKITYLYSFRPHGLSSGSSTMGYKLLILLILFDYLKLKNKIYFFLKILSIIALIIVFSRTPLIAYFLYLFIKSLFNKNKLLLLFIGGIFIFYIILFTDLRDLIMEQFNRGKNHIDLSYRNILWKEQFNFIKDHILLGNHGFKYLVPLKVYGPNVFEHAHNSYIEILSTYGIVIFIFYILLIILYINKKNIIYLIPILILSTYQYAIFWGISLMDIIFLTILLNKETYDYIKYNFSLRYK